MQISMYTASVPIFIKFLGNLSSILDKGVLHATDKKIDMQFLLNDRLAPDMFPFIRQVQIACRTAIEASAGLAGVEKITFENTEKDVEELKARIDKTITFLKALNPEQFTGSEERPVSVYFMPGKHLPGIEYLTELALPNFYFHLTTAYAILRHNGVNLGKGDYIGSLAFRDSEVK